MFRFIVVISLATLALGVPTKLQSHQNKFIGGKDGNINDVPYQVSLQYYGSHYCGASIINEKWIVTAAHCTFTKFPSEFTIRAATSNVQQGGQIVNVSAIYENPHFDFGVTEYDIAVLELETPITFGPGAQPIPLAEQGSVPSGNSQATISGWGIEVEYNKEQLQVVTVPIVGYDDCVKQYGEYIITDDMICTGKSDESVGSSCKHDGGGPVVVDNQLVGVVSWGYGCGFPNVSGVAANIGSFRSFIDGIVESKYHFFKIKF